MKKLLQALGFQSADEMEKNIQLRSIRLAWAYSGLFLLAWIIYEQYHGRENFLPTVLFLTQNLIAISTQLIQRARMLGGAEDEGDPSPEKRSRLARLNDLATPMVVSVVMILVMVIMLARFLLGR